MRIIIRIPPPQPASNIYGRTYELTCNLVCVPPLGSHIWVPILGYHAVEYVNFYPNEEVPVVLLKPADLVAWHQTFLANGWKEADV